MLPYQTSTQAWPFSTQQEQLSMTDVDKMEEGRVEEAEQKETLVN